MVLISKKSIVPLFLVCCNFLQAQYSELYRGELPSCFSDYTIQDSLEEVCQQNWKTNAEWQECNGNSLNFWKSEVNKQYALLLVLADSTLIVSIKDYQLKWESNLDVQNSLFFEIYKAKPDFFGREDYMSYGGTIAANYRKHAFDLKMLVYYLKKD